MAAKFADTPLNWYTKLIDSFTSCGQCGHPKYMEINFHILSLSIFPVDVFFNNNIFSVLIKFILLLELRLKYVDLLIFNEKRLMSLE